MADDKKTKKQDENGSGVSTPDPEVDAKAKRRTFSAAYKLGVLEEAEGASEGEIGELLRRKGLYSSHLTTWRRQRQEGALEALGRKRGRKAKARDKEKERLIKENERLRRKLEQAEKIIEIQKNARGDFVAISRRETAGLVGGTDRGGAAVHLVVR